MSYQQVSKIFETLAQRHRAASEACRLGEVEATANSRDALLLSRLETFEAKACINFQEEKSATNADILDTWIQYVPMEPVDLAIEQLQNATPDQIPERLLAFHMATSDLLRTISEQVNSDQVSEFFRSLTGVEESYSRQCAMTQVRGDEM